MDGAAARTPAVASDAVAAGHPQIHEHDVGSQRARDRHGLGGRGGLAHHLDVGLRLKDAGQAGAHDGVVVHEKHPDHVRTSVLTVVPAPGALWTDSTPPICSTRLRMAPSPYPVGPEVTTNPQPSSLTSSTTVVAPNTKPQRHLARPGMLAHVVQRLLRGPQQHHLHAGGQLARLAFTGEDDRQAVLGGELLRKAAQRVGQGGVGERGRGQRAHQGPRLVEVLPGGAGGQGEVPPGLLRVVGQLRVRGLHQHDHTGQSLSDGVVDLAGEALPLRRDAGLVGEAGDFGPRAREFLDQFGAFGASSLDPDDRHGGDRGERDDDEAERHHHPERHGDVTGVDRTTAAGVRLSTIT